MFALLSAVVLLSATPAAGEADTTTKTDKSEIKLVIGASVTDREVRPFDDGKGPVAGDTVFAWTELKGFDGDSVDQVWSRDGAEVARHTLSVGSPRRWRSWSHNRVRAGAYEVRVLAPDGSELAKQAFTVGAP